MYLNYSSEPFSSAIHGKIKNWLAQVALRQAIQMRTCWNLLYSVGTVAYALIVKVNMSVQRPTVSKPFWYWHTKNLLQSKQVEGILRHSVQQCLWLKKRTVTQKRVDSYIYKKIFFMLKLSRLPALNASGRLNQCWRRECRCLHSAYLHGMDIFYPKWLGIFLQHPIY